MGETVMPVYDVHVVAVSGKDEVEADGFEEAAEIVLSETDTGDMLHSYTEVVGMDGEEKTFHR